MARDESQLIQRIVEAALSKLNRTLLHGTNSIEGIMLKLPEQRTLYLNATSFKKLKRLRILIFANVVLSTAIGYLSNELRLIDLPGYQFPTLPFNSGPKQLVTLNMPHNHIHQLDKEFKNFERLKVLNFSHSKFLRKIPDLSTAPNLESLYVDHCASLVEIHESIGLLTKLVTLEAQHCNNLSTVPSNLVSKYFRTLDFQGCSRLQIFPNIVHKIEFISSLNLSGTRIKELPSSIDHVVALKMLHLSDCKKLVHIPSSIYNLVFLFSLDLNGCTNLSKFPNYDAEIHDNFKLSILSLRNCNLSEEDFLATPCSFPMLKSLDLSGNKFVSLPSIRKLSKLFYLGLDNCQLLGEIPELPECQMNINATYCRSLVDTTSKIIAKHISNNAGFLRDSEIEVMLAGSDIPDWFTHKPETKSITLDVTRNMLMKLAAVTICTVFKSSIREVFSFSFELLNERDFCVRSINREIIVVEPGHMYFVFLPACALFSEFLRYSTSREAIVDFIQKIEKVRKIKVSFSGWKADRAMPSFGIHVLWDGDEVMIEGKQINVPCSISHIIDRTLDDFANEDS
ncbi:hypothetical protein FEM48_Zijuj05G0168200 [Ziziphus jujuba var. spinosa]|uniref:TMV resistance protein N-like n=1 Tax=Ziziphus jujuba var. spinosa TaxID=714518 RepID=A0A978VFZ5_ZIZJJ|nr:hypothetical protein FEM48_Zijuj05G0168200 [Ziziphus jujuba var. spinosa]